MYKYEFNVGMTCDGCKNAVERILKKNEKIISVEAITLEKKVYVMSDEADYQDQIIEDLSKWSNANNKPVEFEKVTEE